MADTQREAKALDLQMDATVAVSSSWAKATWRKFNEAMDAREKGTITYQQYWATWRDFYAAAQKDGRLRQALGIH